MDMKPSDTPATRTAPRRENMWLSLGCNILIPVLLLTKGGDWLGFPPSVNLVVALIFPLGYGIYDWFRRSRINFISILGLVSVLLTGGIGLLQLPSEWIAVKEAAIPFVIGVAVLVSQYTPTPLVRFFLLNPEVVHLDRIEEKIAEKDARPQFDRLIQTSTWLVAASFFLSTILNYVLARIIVVSPAGTAAFNAELGKLQGLSYIVIVVPSMAVLIVALFRLFGGLRRLTGLEWEEMIRGGESKEEA